MFNKTKTTVEPNKAEPDLTKEIQEAEEAFKERQRAHIEALDKPSNPLRISRALPTDAYKDRPRTDGGWVVEKWEIYSFRRMFGGYGFFMDQAYRLKNAQEREPDDQVMWSQLSPVFPRFEDAELFLKRWLDPNFDTIEYDESGNRVDVVRELK